MELANQLMTYFANNTQQAASDLQVAAHKVHKIIKAIGDQLEQLDPDTFKHGAHIDPPAFGDAQRAPVLALHYTKAHGVVTDTLVGVKTDLENFQSACHKAHHDLVEADNNAADRLKYLQAAVTALTTGALSDQGDADHRAAQYAHANDTVGEN